MHWTGQFINNHCCINCNHNYYLHLLMKQFIFSSCSASEHVWMGASSSTTSLATAPPRPVNRLCGLVSRATLTDGFHITLSLRELGVNCFHAVNKGSWLEAIATPPWGRLVSERERHSGWAGEGSVCSQPSGQVSGWMQPWECTLGCCIVLMAKWCMWSPSFNSSTCLGDLLPKIEV